MEFDITHLDKILVLQTLYLHADPVGRGIDTYEYMLEQGKIVEGLPKEECEKLLKKKGLIDYHNGKPLKLLFSHRKNGQVILSSHPYDIYHGQYRFFEALLAIFDLEEITIQNKEDIQFNLESIDESQNRIEKIAELNYLMNNLIVTATEFGTAYKFNSSKVNYKSGYLKELGL